MNPLLRRVLSCCPRALCLCIAELIALSSLTAVSRAVGARQKAAGLHSAAQNRTQDSDADGLPDALEQELAEKYAPIVYYNGDEPNLPTSVEVFLLATELWYYDSRCKPRNVRVCDCDMAGILKVRRPPCKDEEGHFDGRGTRSANKKRTLYLKNVAGPVRKGSRDTRDWVTYFHAYRNDSRGVSIQYWRFYPFNTGVIWGRAVGLGSHGGDWEAVHVVLGPAPLHQPLSVHFLGHRDISSKPWSSLLLEGNHPLVRAEKGDHTSHAFTNGDRKSEREYIRHESWTGGNVRWPSSRPPEKAHAAVTLGGPLFNLGEKTAPMPGMEFIQYSGLWGSRKEGLLRPSLRSGYWGPAYNETTMKKDGFITAWCLGMEDLMREERGTSGVIRECYPTSVVR